MAGEAMERTETRVQMARRHVAEQEVLIEKQKTLIAHLAKVWQPTELAYEMLGAMERTLEIYRADLERLTDAAG